MLSSSLLVTEGILLRFFHLQYIGLCSVQGRGNQVVQAGKGEYLLNGEREE